MQRVCSRSRHVVGREKRADQIGLRRHRSVPCDHGLLPPFRKN
jgi:hypothetical protein